MSWVSVWQGDVATEWIDDLGHVGFLEYQRLADVASLEIWRRAKGQDSGPLEFVMTETHVRYLKELRVGMPVEVFSSVIEADAKRFQLLHQIRSGDEVMCTVETLNLCFDPERRRVAEFSAGIAAFFAEWPAAPDDVTPVLSIRRR
jgi:acyl-CoA thioester hydrolase